jgi:tRNA1Val (adenine37-N6)-methyltransferase
VSPTRDSLWGGQVTLWQPGRGAGYRFNLDPVLLAAFTRARGHVLDVGAGCGVIGLLLLRAAQAERVTAVEVQPELAALARQNASENGFAERLAVLEGDVRRLELPAVDAVVCNPPYFKLAEGRGAPHDGREIARHERHGDLAELVTAGAGALRHGGTFALIITAQRANELCSVLGAAGAALRGRG